ncbi:hypothetical protein CQW23_31900 [Capsicum baccatum]|uniref:Uncharacterized protein n=1 Tax=Capsicum baccatum TaxID=33114 RepID=A0A2G2V6I6_CAPBA|nr:hypothetical protein CQW23_31900 [Capsicum baccatum]
MVVAKQIVEDISEEKMKLKSRSSTILRFLSLMLVLMIVFLSFSVTDSPILATPGSIIDLRFSNVSIPSHIPVIAFPVLPKANSYFKQFSGEAVSYFSKLINDLGRIDDVHPIKFMNMTALEASSNIYHGYLKGSTAEGNESDSSERNLGQGLTTSNVEVELAESQSFIADNALESMIDNPESIVKEISAVAESQPLEMMESLIRHDEDNVCTYQIMGISSLVMSLLAGTVLYVKRRSDKTLHPVAVSSKKFATHHVVKEKHSSQNWPTEVDVAGVRRPSEMSIFQISSSHSKKYPKSENDEAQSIKKKPRKSNRRESLAASEFSMGSPSYESFTTYVRIPAKHASRGEEVIIPVRRS